MIASNAAALAKLTEGLSTADVDLSSEVAVGLGLSGASGCEMRVVNVEVNRADDLVEAIVELPKQPCSAVAVGRVVVLALSRASLPAVPFAVRTKFANCEQQCTGPSLSVESLA